MRIVIFNLGKTFIDERDKLLEGAVEMLRAVRGLFDPDGELVQLALVYDSCKVSKWGAVFVSPPLVAKNKDCSAQRLAQKLQLMSSGRSTLCPGC